MDVNKARMIAYDIRNAINTGVYANNIGAEKIPLQSNHKSDIPQSKTNTIKLNESRLRCIIAESIRKVLNELRG